MWTKFALAFCTLPQAASHRPAVNGVSCGTQFSTTDTALLIHDISVEWSMNRVVTCEGQMLWLYWDVPQSLIGQKLYVSAGSLHASNGNQRADRMHDLKIDAALFGPGYAAYDRTGLPAHVDIPNEAAYAKGINLRSADDLSTCAHSEWLGAMDPPQVQLEGGMCSFYEGYGKTWQTVTLDATPEITAAGRYTVGSWLRGGTTGKFWLAVGIVGGVEDFVTSFRIPTAECNCAQEPRMTGNMMADVGSSVGYFYEKTSDNAIPPEVVTCADSPALTTYCGVIDPPDNSPQGNTALPDTDMFLGCGQIDGCESSRRFANDNFWMHGGMSIVFSGDADLDFVRGMIPHHAGAVRMCETLMDSQSATSADLIHFCDHLRIEQGIELKIMQDWMVSHGGGLGEKCEDPTSMGCGPYVDLKSSQEFLFVNHKMHLGMAIEYSCDAEVDFVRGMIPHHQGAVDMCEIRAMFGNANDAVLNALCATVTRVQHSEIMWMSMVLNEAGNALVAPCANAPNHGGGGSGGSGSHGEPSNNAAPSMPCEDIFALSDACHFYGDLTCRCAALTDEFDCGTQQTIAGKAAVITDLCQRTCGGCSTRAMSMIGHNGGITMEEWDAKKAKNQGGAGELSDDSTSNSSALADAATTLISSLVKTGIFVALLLSI